MLSVTGDIHIINLQVHAADAEATARADGTYAAKIKRDRRYFIWQGELQTIPLGTETAPAAFARGLRQALPLVNTLRVPFNAYSFNPDGSLDPRFETFLDEAARQGFRLLFVYADGAAQRYGGRGDNPDATSLEIEAALRGEIGDRARGSFDRLLTWLDTHAEVRSAVYGLELVNEPAAYKTGFKKAGSDHLVPPTDFVTLYARQMVALAQHVAPRFGGAIVVDGWGYAGSFDILAATPMAGADALAYIRDGVGPRLVWSAHLYPGWAGTKHATTAAEVAPRLDTAYRVLGADNILVTETNLKSSDVYDPFSARPVITAFAQSAAWFANHGIGLGWFQGVQGGPSCFVSIDAEGRAEFDNLASYAGGMNAFSLADRSRDGAAPQVLTATLLPGTVALEKTMPDFLLHHLRRDPVKGLGLAVGGGAGDRLTGRADADNMLYGGRGNDVLQARGPHDFLYGQDDNDTVVGWGGNDHLFGGRGNDLVISLVGFDTLFGGPGADRFSVAPGSKAVIADFAPEDGDTIDFRGHYASLAEVLRHSSVLDYNGDGSNDLLVWHGKGGYTVVLGMGDRLVAFAGALAEFAAPAALPAIPAAQRITGTPYTPTNRTDPAGPTASPRPAPPAVAIPAGPGRTLAAAGAGGTLIGTRGDDIITGGRGDDVVVTGDGNDTVRESHGHNRIFLGNGDDSVQTGRVSTTVVAGDGKVQIDLDIRHQGHDIWLGRGADTLNVAAVQRKTSTRVFGFDPAHDRILFKGQAIDLDAPPPGMTVSAFARGTRVEIGGAAALYLFAGGVDGGPAAGPSLQADLDAFDPRFDPSAPRRHFGD